MMMVFENYPPSNILWIPPYIGYFFNEGTDGEYLRFSLKRNATKFEFVSRTNNDGTEITYNENDVVNKSSYETKKINYFS